MMKKFKEYISESPDTEDDGESGDRRIYARRRADHFLADVLLAHQNHMQNSEKYDENYYGSIGENTQMALYKHFLSTHFPVLFPKLSHPHRHQERETKIRETLPHISDYVFKRIKQIDPEKNEKKKTSFGDYGGYI